MSEFHDENMDVEIPQQIAVMYPWRWGDLLVTGLRTLGNVIGVLGAGVHQVASDLDAAVNFSRRPEDSDDVDDQFSRITRELGS